MYKINKLIQGYKAIIEEDEKGTVGYSPRKGELSKKKPQNKPPKINISFTKPEIVFDNNPSPTGHFQRMNLVKGLELSKGKLERA
jgi:hypothetical protein